MIVVGFTGAGTAYGIVTHPGDGEPNLIEWTDRPVDELVGRWGSNASCVVISHNCVVTTKHQGGGIGTGVEIGGVNYRVEKIWNHPGNTNPEDPAYGMVDLRIAQLGGADLDHYVEFYGELDEVDFAGCMVIGGRGVGRGEVLTSNGLTYGYAWEDMVGASNRSLRWCTNEIDSVQENVIASNTNGQVDNIHSYVVADFDDPGATEYEGAVAGYDSGGGWFIKTDSGWELVGLTWGVEHAESEEAWFRLKRNPSLPSPDRMYGLRMSSYAEWARDVLECVDREPPIGDFSGDCKVGVEDVAMFAGWWLEDGCSPENDNCMGRDLNGDERVDFADFAQFAKYFGSESE